MASAVLFLWKAVAQAGASLSVTRTRRLTSFFHDRIDHSLSRHGHGHAHASLSQVAKFSTPGTRRTAQGTAASDFTEEHVAVLDTARHLWSLR
ncbi:hypothetical protein PVAP13_9KG646801 [Panicum virgatum]|uniref:Secreted protein n=1 Tax=Panicum virgatum TaxID=38727 RepID=A0A8T0P0I8_PANVG|nr:hypothetical protein PVAP13_9KG646801 [Panicum virgatum]